MLNQYTRAGKAQILLTNDDGIQSHGLWAAAQVLSELGYVHVIAPRRQYSGAGRSLPNDSDGKIEIHPMQINGQQWTVYAVGGSPAQAVLHAVLELIPEPLDLVVSGINYGENVGTSVTTSGTVGAALEGAAQGIPSLAVSLETHKDLHHSVSKEVDFSASAHFTRLFARLLLEQRMPFDVDLLKVDVPDTATPDTPWEMARQARLSPYVSLRPNRSDFSQPLKIDYTRSSHLPEGSETDMHALYVRRTVAVTPLSLDLTSRLDLAEFERQARRSLE